MLACGPRVSVPPVPPVLVPPAALPPVLVPPVLVLPVLVPPVAPPPVPPVAPPERLIVTGAYRRVRNPMYVAVVSLILGQAALFASLPLAIYGAVVWTGFHAFVLGYEEPTLRRLFPEDYAAFFAAVPRWIPRLTPWRG